MARSPATSWPHAYPLKTARSSRVELTSAKPDRLASRTAKSVLLPPQPLKLLRPAHSFRVSDDERRPASRTPFRLRRDSTRINTGAARRCKQRLYVEFCFRLRKSLG